jgi:hypothetical protein
MRVVREPVAHPYRVPAVAVAVAVPAAEPAGRPAVPDNQRPVEPGPDQPHPSSLRFGWLPK